MLDSALLLNWQRSQPGAQLLRRTLPVFLAGVLPLGLVLALPIRHALNSARRPDGQFDSLIASQAELSRSERRFGELAEEAIAQALIGLGRTLGLRVAATGVETPGQLDWLRAQQCDEVQGALFGHALAGSELLALLKNDLLAGLAV